MSTMRFVLVHGGRSSGKDWAVVADGLRTAGHAVRCPDLSDAVTAHLADHVAEIIAVLDQSSEPAVLPAHSDGGFPACEAAQTRVARQRALVLIDAAVTAPGQSLFDLFHAHGLDPVRDFAVEALPLFIDPSRIDWNLLRPLAKTYALCTRSRFLPIAHATCARLSRLGPEHGWQTRTLASGHAAMAERPTEVTALLLAAADGPIG
jgi:pimeloyl-ACP methyl ester carboxylesterase